MFRKTQLWSDKFCAIVYLPRFPFLILVSLSTIIIKQFANGYVLRGEGHTAASARPDPAGVYTVLGSIHIDAEIGEKSKEHLGIRPFLLLEIRQTPDSPTIVHFFGAADALRIHAAELQVAVRRRSKSAKVRDGLVQRPPRA